MLPKLYMLLIVMHRALQEDIRYEFCAEECQNFMTRHINCKEAKSLDCMLQVHNGTANFTTVTYENALLAVAFLPELEVVANFHPDLGDSFDEDGVVVVRKNLINGINGLKGYKYCAPSSDALYDVSRNFQDTLLDKYDINICNIQGESILEKKLGGLSELLGLSCLPGQWVENVEYDRTLKQKFSKLVELCGKSSYTQTENGSFNCFLNGDGDVALTNLTTVQNYIRNGNDISQYRFLCPRNYIEMLSGSCSWKRQETLLITNRGTSSTLSTDLKVWFKDYLLLRKPENLDNRNGVTLLRADDSKNLKNVLFPRNSKINVTNPKPLGDYLKDIPSLNEKKLCDLDVKWCTMSNNEQEKCNWLARAAASYDIKPDLVCSEENTSSACLHAVRTGKVDIAKVDIKIYSGLIENLNILKYPIANNTAYEYIVITKSVFSEEDIKYKKGCYGGIGHAKSIKYDVRNSEALECFHQTGDFAVLEKSDDLNLNVSYTLLCENGESVQYTKAALNNCTWSIPITALVSHKGNPKIKNIEIFLSEIIRQFVKRKQSAFRLFEEFQGKKNLLFLDNTVTLSDPRNDAHSTVQTYNKLLHYLNYTNDQVNLNPTKFLVLLCLLFLF